MNEKREPENITIIYTCPDCSFWIHAALFLVGTIFGAALIILAGAIWG